MPVRTTCLVLIGCMAAIVFAGCREAKGPVIVNLAGATAQIQSRYADGHTVSGVLEDQKVLWVGYVSAEISTLEAKVSGCAYSLTAQELRTPIGQDRCAAFLLRPTGFEKVSLHAAFGAAQKK